MITDSLTRQQYGTLLTTLGPFADRVERVDLYGSRARGDHSPGSDIDLIVAGDVDLETLLSMAVALDESDLSVFVDVQCYHARLDPAFARGVARDARPLFTREDLRAAPALPPTERDWRDW